MKISLIISVYKNIPALKTILDALKLQTWPISLRPTLSNKPTNT